MNKIRSTAFLDVRETPYIHAACLALSTFFRRASLRKKNKKTALNCTNCIDLNWRDSLCSQQRNSVCVLLLLTLWLKNGHCHSPPLLLCLIRDVVKGFNAQDVGVRIFEDFASSWPWILLWVALQESTVHCHLLEENTSWKKNKIAIKPVILLS